MTHLECHLRLVHVIELANWPVLTAMYACSIFYCLVMPWKVCIQCKTESLLESRVQHARFSWGARVDSASCGIHMIGKSL